MQRKTFHYTAMAFGVYAVLGAVLLYIHYYLIGVDGVCYLSIAREYLAGNFAGAVNGYWSPLFSWLLAPFLYCGASDFLATKVLQFLVGLAALAGMLQLARKYGISDSIRPVILLIAAFLIACFAYTWINPDLLLLCILIYYCNILFSPAYLDKSHYGLCCGAVGAFAYLAKSYAFPFFLIHFPLMHGLYYMRDSLKEKRKTVLRNFALGMVAFLLISGAWVSVISTKYKKFTITQAAGFSWTRQYMSTYDTAQVYSDSRILVFGPPDKWAVSFLQECGASLEKQGLKIKDRAHFLWWRFTAFIYQIFEFGKVLYSFSFFSTAILAASFLYFLHSRQKLSARIIAFWPLLTAVLFSSGYLILLSAENRYLFFVALLLLLLGGRLLTELFQYPFFTPRIKKITLILFSLSFLMTPLKNAARDINYERNVYNASKALKQLHLKGNFASQEFIYSHVLTYYLGGYLYLFDFPSKNLRKEELEEEFKRNDIDYYLVFENWGIDIPYLSDYREVAKGVIPGAKIYNVKVKAF